MIGLQIRDARPSDRGAIKAVTLSAFQEYAALMLDHWELYRQNILTTLDAVEPAAKMVAEQDNAIVGTVLLYPAGTVIANPGSEPFTLTWPEVRLLAVAPAARGQGIGAALMHECIRRARRSGAQSVMLHTTDLMQTAMRLYERLGFRHVPELDFQPAPGVTINGYRLDLDKTASLSIRA
jgi:predicted N-acetyltransferase YhbS